MTVIKQWNSTTSTWDVVLAGPQGAAGAQGAQGATGAQGAQGVNPSSEDDQLILAYQVFS